MIQVHTKDPYIVLQGPRKDFIPLEKHFNRIPQYQMLRSYKGIPRAEVFLHRTQYNGEDVYYMSRGLSQELMNVCKAKGIGLNGLESTYKETITLDEFTTLCNQWSHLRPRDYQIEAAWNIVNRSWSTSELATRAGKTLICSLVLRYLMEIQGYKKVLYIVPSIHLVKQGVQDLKDYMNWFDLGEVWADGDVQGTENCIIGTFQSIVLRLDPTSKHYNPDFFRGVDIVLVDEAHKAQCKSINTILSNLKDVRVRFGVTGTIPKDPIDRFKILALLGPTIQTISASELIDEGFLAEAVIQQVHINHRYEQSEYIEQAERVLYKELPLAIQRLKALHTPEEYVGYLESALRDQSKAHVLENYMVQINRERLQTIYNLCHPDKNTIVFIHNVEYGRAIKDYIESQGREVYLINGSTSLKRRQKILGELEAGTGKVLVGSFGCVGTGLTFNNIDIGIFAQSFKSDIITKQSLGRLMLRNKQKSHFELYDLVDHYPTGKLIQHGKERMKIYKRENLI